MVGFYQADYLTHADPVIPDWFKITFLGEAENAIRLGTKFLFADMELSTSDSIWGLLPLFFFF